MRDLMLIVMILNCRDKPSEGRAATIVREFGGYVALGNEGNSKERIVGVYFESVALKDEQLRVLGGDLPMLLHLDCLHLGNTPITDAGLQALEKTTQLKWLLLYNTDITDGGLERLATLTSLQQLSLSDTKVTGVGFKKLASLGALYSVRLSRTPLSDAGLDCLLKLRSI